jgi:release factor glutamine methyltransferase
VRSLTPSSRSTRATTVAEALRSASRVIPRREAEDLAAFSLRVRWGDLWARMDEPFDADTFDALVSRRADGEPLQYILGSASFHGVEIACGPGVLVPRPETETLVDVALGLIRDLPRPVVVDIGTGSGAIAAAIAAVRPDADVYATEKSAAACEWARRNVANVYLGDLFEPLPPALRGAVDLIVSNPPYIPDGTPLPADVAREPSEALYAGQDGCDVLRRIVAEAGEWLRPGACIALEIGTPDQIAVLQDAAVTNDLAGRPRVLSRTW